MTNDQDTATQPWASKKTFSESGGPEDTVAYSEGLDDIDLEESAPAEPRHAVMPARGQAREDDNRGIFGRLCAWLRGLIGDS